MAAPHAGSAPANPADTAASSAAPAATTAALPQQKAPKKDKAAKDGTQSYPLEMTPPPDFLQQRIDMFNRIKHAHDERMKQMPREEITITLKDGSVKKATSWDDSPLSLAQGISKSLAERTVIAKVDGQLWDLERPFEKDCKLELLDFENDEAKQVWWHSSAHILGECCERHYGAHLASGPPTEDGFFYEMSIPDGSASSSSADGSQRVVLASDYAALEKLAQNVVKDKQKFERLEMTKEELLEMFKYNPFKVHFINSRVPDGTKSTVYRCGPMVDLCRGPHIPHTGRVKALSILKNSSSYWLGNKDNQSLQRIYGVSFPSTDQMKQYKKFLAEAATRDHRKIGREQDLFFFHELSPGSAFWLPHGTRIYNTLVELMRSEYRKRDYDEVISPNMYNSKLWETSGHWQNYADDMFKLDVEKETFALKPMNCPGHALIFASRDRSYKELPMRLADFGVLHRNEASGALSGLTRVRRFQQDDAHHFCRVDQIEQEMDVCFAFLQDIYGMFGFDFQLKLSTRPEKYLGKLETWNEAEDMLRKALDKFKPNEWVEDPGDGAFYGPKIDITIMDALRRKHQCATIQLDFQLPQRFELSYRTAEGGSVAPGGAGETAPAASEQTRARPVMIHRAILGSIERFTAILTEHFAGKWPFWLSPRQVIVIPVAAPFKAYAQEVAKLMWDKGIYAEADVSDLTLPKKVRNGEIAQYNFILVVGQDESDNRSVNIRNRDDGKKGKAETVPLDLALEQMIRLKDERRLENRLK